MPMLFFGFCNQHEKDLKSSTSSDIKRLPSSGRYRRPVTPAALFSVMRGGGRTSTVMIAHRQNWIEKRRYGPLNGAPPLVAWASPMRTYFMFHDERPVMFASPRSRSLALTSLRLAPHHLGSCLVCPVYVQFMSHLSCLC